MKNTDKKTQEKQMEHIFKQIFKVTIMPEQSKYQVSDVGNNKRNE